MSLRRTRGGRILKVIKFDEVETLEELEELVKDGPVLLLIDYDDEYEEFLAEGADWDELWRSQVADREV